MTGSLSEKKLSIFLGSEENPLFDAFVTDQAIPREGEYLKVYQARWMSPKNMRDDLFSDRKFLVRKLRWEYLLSEDQNSEVNATVQRIVVIVTEVYE